jgi:hypothetical protein
MKKRELKPATIEMANTTNMSGRATVNGMNRESGANIHIISGLGSTNDNGSPSGLGNLIIGYDEDPALVNFPLATGDRGGSHNLVIGRWNRFTQSAFGGLVAGELNTIRSEATSVSGGLSNIASGFDASVSGGQSNIASGGQSSVSGGHCFGNS